MAPIAPETVYTKTAKGILEIRNKTVKLSRELGLVFLSIDGKSTVGELLPRSGMTGPQLQNALHTLVMDGYIKAVAQSARPAMSSDSDELDFTSAQAMTKLNMEAASRALAAADANKRAQAEARAALDARLRQESEARARVRAEVRAEAESEARLKAEEAARAAAEERARAEAEAGRAPDANTRADAEARARAAAAAVVRAQAEARVRADAEARAHALAETKRAAEDDAREEALARARSEEQAHARAAAEVRASEALEAQVQAMEGARTHSDNPQALEAEAARARVRELEAAAERAREAARISAEAEGRADEVPQPQLDISDRVRQLNARVQAARLSREDATRRDTAGVDYALDGSMTPRDKAWPSLELGPGTTAMAPVPIAASEMVDLSVLTDTPGAKRSAASRAAEAPAAPVESARSVLPVANLEHSEAMASEHLPGPLERAMAQMAARSQAAQTPARAALPEVPPERAAVERAPEPRARSEAVEPVFPTIDDEEPLHERLNVDRAAHDIIAETAAARKKAEVAQVGRNALSARQKRAQEDAERAAAQRRARSRRKALIGAGTALLIAPLLGAAWLQFMPLDGYIPDAQRALSQRLNQPVSITTLRYVLFPSPRVVLEGVGIGGTQGLRAERVAAHVWPLAAFSGPTSFDIVEAENVEIEPDVLGTIPAWTGGRTAGAIQADRLLLTGLKLKLNGAELEPLNGDIAFAPNGTVRSAVFESPKVKLELTPQPEGVRVALNAVGWRVPYGPPVEFGLLNLRGLIDQRRVAAAEFTGRIAGGDIEGAITARWGGPVAVEGEFKLQRVDLQELASATRSSVAARGALRGTGRFSMQAPEWNRLTASPQVEVSFVATRGELTNIDIVRAIQSPAVGAMRGGRSAFEELTGTLQIANGHYIFRRLELRSGPLNAGGTVDVGPADQLSGRIAAELSGRGVRSTLVLGGTVQDPRLQR
jgi:hypothetical protein